MIFYFFISGGEESSLPPHLTKEDKMKKQIEQIERKLNITTGDLPPCFLLFPEGSGYVDQDNKYYDGKTIEELKKHNRLIIFEDAKHEKEISSS